MRVRFAPSPTGPLHIGGARTALYNFLLARSQGGSFVLRIDDTDRARSSEQSLGNILDGMRWLGLDWDEGPEKGGPFAPYSQWDRMDGYQERARALVAAGKAYACFCSPEEVQAGRERMQRERGAAMYDRRCRGLSKDERDVWLAEGRPHTVRFRVPEGKLRVPDLLKGDVEVDLSQIDDWVMLRQDGSPLYNLTSTLDDQDMQITHIVRGEEHFMNAVKQTLLFEALEYPVPRFAHLPLILGKDGKKLSKRVAQTDLLEYRDRGCPAAAMRNFIALLGWGFDAERDLFTLEEAIERFRLEDLSKSGSILDEEKLEWMCGVYIRQMDLDRLLDEVAPFLLGAFESLGRDELQADRPWFRNVLACYQERIRIYGELPGKIAFLLQDEIDYDEKAWKNLTKKPEIRDHLAAYRASLGDLVLPPSRPDRPAAVDADLELPSGREAGDEAKGPAGCLSPRELEGEARKVAESLGIGFGQLVHPIRAALTGTTAGAGLFDLLYLLGREKVEERLDRAIAKLAQHNG